MTIGADGGRLDAKGLGYLFLGISIEEHLDDFGLSGREGFPDGIQCRRRVICIVAFAGKIVNNVGDKTTNAAINDAIGDRQCHLNSV